MSIDQLTSEPASLYVGDTINWLIAVPDYPATAGWTLKYKAVSAAGYFAITSAASGADHLVSVAMATTDDYLPGDYVLVKYVESGTERITLAELALEVKPFLSGKSAAFDNRSHAKKMLDAIEATLEGTASTDQLKLTIDGTSLERRSVADLLKLRDYYTTEYAKEQAVSAASRGQKPGNKILARF